MKKHSFHSASTSHSHSLKCSFHSIWHFVEIIYYNPMKTPSWQFSSIMIFFNSILFQRLLSWDPSPPKALCDTVIFKHALWVEVFITFFGFSVIHGLKKLEPTGLYHFINLFRILWPSVYLDRLKNIIPPYSVNASKIHSALGLVSHLEGPATSSPCIN